MVPANSADLTRFLERGFARPKLRNMTGNTLHCQSEECFEMKMHGTLFISFLQKKIQAKQSLNEDIFLFENHVRGIAIV